MKQPMEDLGRAFGFFSEDTVHQESLWKRKKLSVYRPVLDTLASLAA